MNNVMIQPVGQVGVRLISLIKKAVGHRNFDNIDEIFRTEDQFRRMVVYEGSAGKPSLVPFLDGETGFQVVERLVSQGYTFGSTGDLARYMIKNLAEIRTFGGVLSLSEDSWWEESSSGEIYAPYAYSMRANKPRRSFGLFRLSSQFSSRHAVIVFRPE